MATINSVRFININYNNNSMKINDETMHFNGQSTLCSLKNGGGKSVLIQMMMSPFVHKRYRDAEERPFESYFTSAKPSFILVEWKLDGGAGKLLTGMMVRRNQAEIDENSEPLEIIGIISFYRDSCVCDINNLPVVEKSKKEMILKNFGACRQLFDSYKKDNSLTFFYYDLNMQAQSKQYFNKLKEYKIDYKEWEKIIKKVNLKESGLSDLFADCKDERGLIEKWFLETVEEKLNNENNRMSEFQSIIDKHVRQYSENESKIKRRDIINLFKEYVCLDAESKSVLTLANEFVAKENEEGSQENKIANYIKILKTLYAETEGEIETKDEMLQDIRSEISHLTYEKYSCDINDLMNDKKRHERSYVQAEIEKNDIVVKIADIDNRLHQFECAKLNETRQYEYSEYEKLNEKMKALNKNEEDKAPRRNELGGILYTYYHGICDEYRDKIEAHESDLYETNKKLSEEETKRIDLDRERLSLTKQLAAFNEKIRAYDARENEFNENYKANLSRNIIGRYEEGFFEILQEERGTAKKKLENEHRNDKKVLDDKENYAKKLSRDLENTKMSRQKKQHDGENLRKELDALEAELHERKTILKYLELEDSYIYEREKIAEAADRKVSEKDVLIKQLSKEEGELEKEYRALTKGEILELPKEFTEELNNLEINIIFGMEWLKKNGKTESENIELVHKNPFLPYALIMSKNDIHKLENNESVIYTSFPIPIVAREDIEGGSVTSDNRVYSFEGVSFYVYFNENFLDEEKLSILVAKKQEEMAALSQKLDRRKQERDDYIAKRNIVLNQKLSRELYDSVNNGIEETEKEIDRLSAAITELTEEKDKNSSDRKTLEKKISDDEKRMEKLESEIRAIGKLFQEYKVYLENRSKREETSEKLAGIEYKIELAGHQVESLREKIRTLENNKSRLNYELDKYGEKFGKYKSYEDIAEKSAGYKTYADIVEKSAGYKTYADIVEKLADSKEISHDAQWTSDEITKLEAEYEAITTQISMEKQDLEERLKKQSGRLDKAEKELNRLMKRYSLSKESFAELKYDEEETEHQQTLRVGYEEQRSLKETDCNRENANIQVIKAKIDGQLSNMKRETGHEEPLAESRVVRKNFDSEINQLKFKDGEVQKEKVTLETRIRGYGENIAGLAEFDELSITSEMDFSAFNTDFKRMSGSELTQFKGILIRDYNKIKSEKAECKEGLERRLNQIILIEEFEDDYFKKPIEAMVRLVDTPAEVIRQIDTTVRSYDELMKKIEVDISIIEREREEIVSQLLDYIKEVHDNLGKIDSNSTIKIHDRSVKMLKLEIPQWQENSGMYENRVKDFVDDITKKGVELYHNNENTFNYFGTRINTKNLYDVVVGISNVQIKLFKVEQYKEYPITWAEVAKNSGGEGFLSSFVILSSLLYYMRKDENDIFADHNEGKVLLMDNPFAATYSEHLLKPLMRVAKKNNTQLICLTGLGGDSIYGRFDNIYVLNLVSAGLKRGVQYLRTDHVRGSEPDVMVVSHVEVGEPEQLTLF